jgi:enoyl-CoA hydratase/carnithine racemase
MREPVEAAVLTTTVDGVARIMLNRPKSLNAINGEVHQGLLRALDRATVDEEVRAIVVTGSGTAFSAGGDLKAVAAGEDMGDPLELARAIWNSPKPVVAAVHGYCLGQAMELTLCCDLVVAASDATFGEVEVNHGWGPPILVTPYVAGMKHAMEVLLLGEVFGAMTALERGLINRVVAPEQLESETARVTSRLVSLGADVLASNKRLIHAAYERAGFNLA